MTNLTITSGTSAVTVKSHVGWEWWVFDEPNIGILTFKTNQNVCQEVQSSLREYDECLFPVMSAIVNDRMNQSQTDHVACWFIA